MRANLTKLFELGFDDFKTNKDQLLKNDNLNQVVEILFDLRY